MGIYTINIRSLNKVELDGNPATESVRQRKNDEDRTGGGVKVKNECVHIPQTNEWMEEVVQGHRLHALDWGYTHAKRFKHQNIQYGTAQYGTVQKGYQDLHCCYLTQTPGETKSITTIIMKLYVYKSINSKNPLRALAVNSEWVGKRRVCTEVNVQVIPSFVWRHSLYKERSFLNLPNNASTNWNLSRLPQGGKKILN